MSKTWIVLKHEFKTIASKPSFWFGIIGMPIVMGALFVVIELVSGAATVAVIAERESRPGLPQGYVDQAGIIAQAEAGFEPFADEPAALRALEANAIAAYYVIEADYLSSGRVRRVSKEVDDSLLGSRRETEAFDKFIARNLLGDDALFAQLDRPVNIRQSTAVAPTRTRTGPSLGGFSPLMYGIAVLFFIVLMTASAYLMQSATKEKENRVIEVVMSSVPPIQLLTGKILGLSLIALIHLVLWFGSAIVALVNLPFLRTVIGPISPAAVATTVVFFVLGYFVYASLLAGLGAMMPGTRETTQYAFFVLFPLFIPIYLNTAIGVEPNGTIATVLSLFPFTSPIVMPMRLFATREVPVWQVVIGGVLLAMTVGLAINAAARAFRAQSLLSGTKPSLRQIVAALR